MQVPGEGFALSQTALTAVVVVESIVLAYVIGRLNKAKTCCKKAEQAYKGCEKLFKWAKAISLPHNAAYWECIANKTLCQPSDPAWPPQDPGDFPE
jgi:hypothetical protein